MDVHENRGIPHFTARFIYNGEEQQICLRYSVWRARAYMQLEALLGPPFPPKGGIRHCLSRPRLGSAFMQHRSASLEAWLHSNLERLRESGLLDELLLLSH